MAVCASSVFVHSRPAKIGLPLLGCIRWLGLTFTYLTIGLGCTDKPGPFDCNPAPDVTTQNGHPVRATTGWATARSYWVANISNYPNN